MSDEVAEAREQLQQFKGTIPPKDPLRNYLKLIRESRFNSSEDVAVYGSMLLQHHRNKLPEEELWALHEQVSIALMECGNLTAALPLVKAVLLKFPDSIRAKRLQGLYYAAQGHVERAKQLYQEILKDQPHNDIIPKQLAGLHHSMGQLSEAIDILRTYLDHYMNDREAWEELADYYLEACMYKQAAFCLEEVLTMGVLNPLTLIKLADTLVTLGGAAQLKTARAYYSKALQVTNGCSVRALYGLIAIANQLTDKDAGPAGSAAQELPKAAAEKLVKMYTEQAPDKLPMIKQALARYLKE